MTQAIAYGTIKGLSENQIKPRTQKMLQKIKIYVKKVNSAIPNNSMIWKRIRNKDFSRQVRVFLWKMLHDAYKVGQYWDYPSMDQALRDQVQCKHNNCTDLMEHILSECTSPGQIII